MIHSASLKANKLNDQNTIQLQISSWSMMEMKKSLPYNSTFTYVDAIAGIWKINLDDANPAATRIYNGSDTVNDQYISNLKIFYCVWVECFITQLIQYIHIILQ